MGLGRELAIKLATELAERHAGTLDEFRRLLVPLFEKRAQGKNLDRKPPLGIRLQADASTRMIAAPFFQRNSPSRGGNFLLCDHVELELLRERKFKSRDGETLFKPSKVLVVYVTPESVKARRWFRKELERDFETLVGIARDYIEDPAMVFARCSDHCGLCGRHLTDGLSRSRGIGPECIENVTLSLVRFYKESIFERTRTLNELEGE